jgi:oligopeptide transport system ATP-binding protein
VSRTTRAESPPSTGDATVLQTTDLVKEFSVRSSQWGRTARRLLAVDHVSFELHAGETLGIVGESGCGKTTLARVLMGLETMTSGSVVLCGEELSTRSSRGTRRARRIMQMVFQDPYGSLDPRMTVSDLVSEPWMIHSDVVPQRDRRARVAELLTLVGLDPGTMDNRPRAFSGGQRQRIGIARALALSPKILILDEPVAALDVSIQAQVIELLRDLQDRLGLAMIFIAHDLAVVRSLAHRVAVMYLGRIVEMGPADAVYRLTSHPYTTALLSSVPAFRSDEATAPIKLEGEVPSALNPPNGCPFRTRCWKAQEVCAQDVPPLVVQKGGQRAACFFPD